MSRCAAGVSCLLSGHPSLGEMTPGPASFSASALGRWFSPISHYWRSSAVRALILAQTVNPPIVF
jgi:hypothetical protein